MIRKMRVTFVLMILISHLFSGVLFSGVIPGRWEKLEVQAEGTSVIVTMKSSDRFKGIWRGLEGEGLKLEGQDGQIRLLPRSGIARVETPADSLANGMLAGGMTGALVFGVLVATLSQIDGFDAKNGVAAGAIMVGIGVGAGAAIDASSQHREVLYEAP